MYVESTNETVRMIRFSVLNRCSSVALPDLWLANCYFAGRHGRVNNVAYLDLLNLPLSVSNWMFLILKAPHLR